MKIKHIFILSAFTVLSFSCIDLEDMNVNPNNATETNPELLLTNIAYSAFSEASTSPAYANKMFVQKDGESSEQLYKWNRYNFDYYERVRDIVKMYEEAERQNKPVYKGLALFFRAHYFYKLTLHFGDIPYSEAVKGESDKLYTPVYDKQEAVMAGILKDLEEANSLLKSENSIISGDIIYSGNLLKWRQLINAYRLKVLLSLSKKGSAGGITIASSFAAIVTNEPLMSGVEDNGQIVFLNQQDNRYPFFNNSGFGSGMYMDSTYIATLAKRKDPRLFAFVTQKPKAESAGAAITDFTSYDGGDPAVPYSEVNQKVIQGNVSKPHPRYYSDPTNEPFILLGYTEQQLILAEAVVKGWINGDDKAYYESAVKASFLFYETYAKEYSAYLGQTAAEEYLKQDLVAYKSGLSNEEKTERIVIQKYIPSFLQGAGWSPFFEHLRTGYPAFRHPAGTQIPYRWMYPQDEYNNNTENVKAALDSQFGGVDRIIDKPWWIK